MKRISFDEQHAIHLYELALEHFCVGAASCDTCTNIKNRLEKFIGPIATKAVNKTIKRNGYCNKLKQ